MDDAQQDGSGAVSDPEPDPLTWFAECVDSSWPDIERHCGSCSARVALAKYNHTCENYCTSIGQFCAGAWEPSADGNGCDMNTATSCTTPMTSTTSAVCQCVKSQERAACAPHRGSCVDTQCCASITDSCFEKDEGWYGCRSSCAPGKPDPMDSPQFRQPWTCTQPHAHAQAKARKTPQWPDLVAVCSTGEVLVQPDAFLKVYDSDCQTYCRKGAARGQLGAEHWISMVGKGEADPVTCPGESNMTDIRGVFCSCSFPDRL